MKTRLQYLIVALAVWVAFADTLTLDYALDDRMIIFENEYTLQGWQGVKNVFTRDAFTGYFGENNNLVAGGRYRPLSQISFIAEYELFGGDLKSQAGGRQDPKNEALFSDSFLPVVQHFNNVLLYMVLCLTVLAVLRKLFPPRSDLPWYASLPFWATLLFALHPLHTEVVANIKGRDEVMAMLGAVLTLYCALRYADHHRWHWLLAAFGAMLFGVFSKENAITFLAVVPLSIYFYKKDAKWQDYLLPLVPMLVASAIFLAVRQICVVSPLSGEVASQHILNNPFRNVGKADEIATVLLTWGIYLKLMIFPYPLTHDYYPNQIEITHFSNPLVLLVLLAVIVLIVLSISLLRKKKTLSFAILYFIITFSITSNLLFNVGTFMNERFVFMPLLGFTLAVALLFEKWLQNPMMKKAAMFCLIAVCSIFTVECAVRNLAWKNDIKLFITDVDTSSKSMKCQLSAGGSYLKLYDSEHKSKYLSKAEKHLLETVRLGRSDDETYSLLGKLYFSKKDFEKSAYYYQLILGTNPEDALAANNLELVRAVQRENVVNEINAEIEAGDVQKALSTAKEALKEQPQNPQILNALGRIYGEKMGQLDVAIDYLQAAIAADDNYASAHENLGIAYAIRGQFDKALAELQHAHQLEPGNQHIMDNLRKVQRNR